MVDDENRRPRAAKRRQLPARRKFGDLETTRARIREKMQDVKAATMKRGQLKHNADWIEER